jgi:hypothetical protein
MRHDLEAARSRYREVEAAHRVAQAEAEPAVAAPPASVAGTMLGDPRPIGRSASS